MLEVILFLFILSPSPPKPHRLQDQCLEVRKLLQTHPKGIGHGY